MGCDSPSPPAAPDYVGAANAQGQANWQTALASAFASNPNVVTPYGSQTVSWNQLPSNTGALPTTRGTAAPTPAPTPAPGQADGGYIGADGGYILNDSQGGSAAPAPAPTSTGTSTPATDYEKWQATITQTLSPEQQALYDATNRINTNLLGIGEGQLNTVGDSMGTPYDPSGLPQRINSVSGGPIQTGVSPRGPIRGDGSGTSAEAQSNLAYGANMAGMPAMPKASDATRQSVEDALYGQMTSRLDPQWAQQEEQMRNQLINQGFTPGSTGYDQAMQNFNMAKTDAYNTATNQAIMSGGEEMQRQFDMGMSSRGQGWTEASGNANIGNTAANSLYGMGATDTSLANAAQNQDFSQLLANAQFGNDAQGQAFSQGLASADFQNANRGQQLSEDMTLRQLPLNELNALRTGVQMQAPSYPGFSGVNAQAGDIAGATNALGQYNTGVYNADAGMYGAEMGALGSLGAAGTMATMSPSGCS